LENSWLTVEKLQSRGSLAQENQRLFELSAIRNQIKPQLLPVGIEKRPKVDELGAYFTKAGGFVSANQTFPAPSTVMAKGFEEFWGTGTSLIGEGFAATENFEV